MLDEANLKILSAERKLQLIDAHQLAVDQREIYHTIYSFLDQAKMALSQKDFAQALNLVQKADILSDELANALR